MRLERGQKEGETGRERKKDVQIEEKMRNDRRGGVKNLKMWQKEKCRERSERRTT